MKLFFNRLYRAARLEPGLFNEVMEDKKAMFQSMMAVFFYSMAVAYGIFGRAGASAINFGMIVTLFGWYVWAISTYFISVRLIPERQTQVDRKSVLRALGFASSPGLICIMALIPDMSAAILLIAAVWMITAAVVALKQALNYSSTIRVVSACLIGGVISAVFQGLLYFALLSVFM